MQSSKASTYPRLKFYIQYECCTKFSPPTLGDEEQHRSKMGHLKAIYDLKKELKENQQVYEEITRKYQVDLQVVKCNELYVPNI